MPANAHNHGKHGYSPRQQGHFRKTAPLSQLHHVHSSTKSVKRRTANADLQEWTGNQQQMETATNQYPLVDCYLHFSSSSRKSKQPESENYHATCALQ
jgi:hypothetical protein